MSKLSCPSWPASGQTSWWNGRVPACDLAWLSWTFRSRIGLNHIKESIHWLITSRTFRKMTNHLEDYKPHLPKIIFKITSHIEDLKNLISLWFCLQRWKKYHKRESPRGGITIQICLLKISPYQNLRFPPSVSVAPTATVWWKLPWAPSSHHNGHPWSSHERPAGLGGKIGRCNSDGNLRI